MIPENRIPTHPGVILSQEFLVPLGISQVAFAAHLGVPVQRINELIRGKRGLTPQNRMAALAGTQYHAGVLDEPPDGARSGPEPAGSGGRATRRRRLRASRS